MATDVIDTASVIAFYILLHSAYCDLPGRNVEFGGPPSAYKIPSISGGPFISRIEDLYGGTIRCSPDKGKAASLSSYVDYAYLRGRATTTKAPYHISPHLAQRKEAYKAWLEGRNYTLRVRESRMFALGGDAYNVHYKSQAIRRGGIAAEGENDYRSHFQSPKSTDNAGPDLPVIISAHGGDAYYKTPENGGSSLPGGEGDFRSHVPSAIPTDKPEVRLPYMSATVGDAYRAYYNAIMGRGVSSNEEDAPKPHYQSPKRTDKSGVILPQLTVLPIDLISASGSDALTARDVSKTKYLYRPNPIRETFMGPIDRPKKFALAGGRRSEKLEDLHIRRKISYNAVLSSKTNKLKPTIAKTGRIFDVVDDKITVSRDGVKASDLIISRIEPRGFGSLTNSKVEPIPCNSTNTTDYFTNETECLNSTQEKTEKTLFLSDETNVDPVATSRNETIIVNHLYGYQPYLDPVYQYIYPIFLGTCLGTTLMLVVVLIKQFQTASGMSRASISILMAIAVSDALTTGFGLSEVCYRFSETSGNPGFLPYRSCNTMFIIGHLSGVVHEASVWLTVVLTTQRFICVTRPFFARRHINLRVSLISIAAIFVVILSFHIYRFFDRSFVKVLLQQSNILDEENFETCNLVYAPWIENPAKYESIFLWLLIALMQLLPCIIIATFVSLIVKTLIKKKTNLVTSETARSQRAQITIIVIVIAIIAVSVELSSGIFLSLCVWGTTTGEFLFSYDTMKSIAVAFDLVLYVSYFVIFLIYCLMSQEVRRVIVAFCKMGRGSKAGKSSTSDFV